MRELLPVLDDFDRALAAMPGGPGDPVRAGIGLVRERLMKILEREGVVPIRSEGQPFDPNLHDAIGERQTPRGTKPGTVLEVAQPGYMMRDRVLRHAKVIVAVRSMSPSRRSAQGVSTVAILRVLASTPAKPGRDSKGRTAARAQNTPDKNPGTSRPRSASRKCPGLRVILRSGEALPIDRFGRAAGRARRPAAAIRGLPGSTGRRTRRVQSDFGGGWAASTISTRKATARAACASGAATPSRYGAARGGDRERTEKRVKCATCASQD